MSNLDNIVLKIKADFEEKKEFLKSEAKNKKNIAKSEFDSKLKTGKENIEKKFEMQKNIELERIVSSLELKCKNILLEKKQTLITNILNELLDNLKNISSDELKGYIEDKLNNRTKKENEKIYISSKYSNLKDCFENVEIDDTILSGFKIKYDGIEENYTFDSLINFEKEKLEEIIQEYLK